MICRESTQKLMSTSKNYPLVHVKLSLLPQPHVTSWTLNHHFRFGGGSAPNKPQQLVWTSHHRPICCYSVPWQCEHQGFGPMGTNPPSLLTGFNPSKGNRRNSKEWFSLNSSTVDVQRAAGVASWRADASLKICEEPPKRYCRNLSRLAGGFWLCSRSIRISLGNSRGRTMEIFMLSIIPLSSVYV